AWAPRSRSRTGRPEAPCAARDPRSWRVRRRLALAWSGSSTATPGGEYARTTLPPVGTSHDGAPTASGGGAVTGRAGLLRLLGHVQVGDGAFERFGGHPDGLGQCGVRVD